MPAAAPAARPARADREQEVAFAIVVPDRYGQHVVGHRRFDARGAVNAGPIRVRLGDTGEAREEERR